MDRLLRAEIVAEVRRSMQEAMETYEEKWVTAKQLCEQVPLFNAEWLKHNWQKLPNERVRWEDEQGNVHECTRCYPKKKILRMISEGNFRMMRAQ